MTLIILVLQGGYGPGKWYHSEGPYSESSRRYECVFFYVDGLYRENVTFEIQYEMNNAAMRYGDCSELYLSFFSEDSVNYLNSFKGQILIPDNDMPSKGNYEAHTFGTNSNDFAYTESDSINPGYHTFLIGLDESELNFRPYNEYIEFTLISYGKDNHKFTDYASINDYYNYPALDELRQEQEEYELTPINARENKIVVLLVFIAFSILALILVLYLKYRVNKKYNFYKPTMQVDYFREIPSNLDPIFASTLVFCKHKLHSKKHDADGYSSVMLSLVRKGYIALEKIDDFKDWTSNNVKIIVKYKPTSLAEVSNPNVINSDKLETLTPSEEQYFNLIIRHSRGYDMKLSDFQSNVFSDYENTYSFVQNIKRSVLRIGVSDGYFQKYDFEEPKKKPNSLSKAYIIIGLIFLIIVNLISYQTRLDLAFGGFTIFGITLILSGILLRVIFRKDVLLSQFGEDEYAKWRGLYNFLNSETLMNERTVIDLPLWEQYLVYATAFGISDKVIKALKIRYPDFEQSPVLSNPYYSSRYFRISSRTFRYVTHRASRISSGSSFGGFSGHGGYGGGGRGGGGGRRRSLIQTLFKLYRYIIEELQM